MNLYFDEVAQKLIVNAKKEMIELKHPYVGSEHLLLAILHMDLDITRLLNSYGITYEGFRNEIIRVVGVGHKRSEWFLFTPLLKRVLQNASYYSKNHQFITPNSLLISIFNEGDGVANRVLAGMTVDLEVLRDKMMIFTEKEEDTLSILEELGINLNEKSLKSDFHPVIGRERQVEEILQNLLRKNKNNPLLIGEAGVGKTAIVEELARRIALGNVPFKLKDKVIYSVSMSQVVAGTRYRGEFEEKFHRLISEAVSHPNIILFIDEVHTLMGAGGAEGAIDASNIVKPYLARGELKMIGATTLREYHEFIEKDKALDRRFQKIYIEEATKSEVKDILLELKKNYEDFHHVNITDKVLSLLIDLSFSCLFLGRQPDKAIDLLDEVCSYVRIHKNKRERQLMLYQQQINEIEALKNHEIIKKNFEKASYYREQENSLKSHYHHQIFDRQKENIEIEEKDLYEVIYQKVRAFRSKDWKRRLDILERHLRREIIGQDSVIVEIIETLKKYDYIQNKECLSLLLVGKSGTGKTFIVEKILENLFDGVNVISLSMAEYKEYSMISKLVGTAPGYVGYQDAFLLQSIQENPFSVLFLDDIEQANPLLLQQLLTAFSEGFITTAKGEKIILSKCILFLTIREKEEELGFSKREGVSFLEKYVKIKHVFSLKTVDETMIRTCLKRNSSQIDEILKRKKYIRDGLRTDWKNRGFHAVKEYLEKEEVLNPI